MHPKQQDSIHHGRLLIMRWLVPVPVLSDVIPTIMSADVTAAAVIDDDDDDDDDDGDDDDDDDDDDNGAGLDWLGFKALGGIVLSE